MESEFFKGAFDQALQVLDPHFSRNARRAIAKRAAHLAVGCQTRVNPRMGTVVTDEKIAGNWHRNGWDAKGQPLSGYELQLIMEDQDELVYIQSPLAEVSSETVKEIGDLL